MPASGISSELSSRQMAICSHSGVFRSSANLGRLGASAEDGTPTVRALVPSGCFPRQARLPTVATSFQSLCFVRRRGGRFRSCPPSSTRRPVPNRGPQVREGFLSWVRLQHPLNIPRRREVHGNGHSSVHPVRHNDRYTGPAAALKKWSRSLLCTFSPSSLVGDSGKTGPQVHVRNG